MNERMWERVVLVGCLERDKGAHMAWTVGDGTQNSHMTWQIKIKVGKRFACMSMCPCASGIILVLALMIGKRSVMHCSCDSQHYLMLQTINQSHVQCTEDDIFMWNYYSHVRSRRGRCETRPLIWNEKYIYIYFFLHLTVAGVFLTAIINAQWFSTSLYHRGL